MDTLKKIGKYKYAQRHCLGQGSFGKVYEGMDDTGRRVAIKKLQQRMIAQDPYLKQSLSTEILIMKKLKHRNIVELIDTVTTANSIYLVLQFCKDGDLKRYSMNKRYSQEQALSILKQLIEGFYAIVKEGIIHRDLKPANVLVHDGIFKICDFGFAKYFGQMNKMARTCVGTPIYMSPQVLKQKPYTSKTDVWSLGVLYYELLFGRLPYMGKSEDQIFKLITRGKLIINKCSEESYIFLKNTLVIDEQERWDWNKVFEHFSIRGDKQKQGFYQNFVNFMKGGSEQLPEKKVIQNHSNSFQKLQNRNYHNRADIRFNYEPQSPQKQPNNQQKVKHNKMARNIFALDQQPQQYPNLELKPRVNSYQQAPRIQQQNMFPERIYKPEQTQKLRWMYNTTIKFLMKQANYLGRIPSFQLFLHDLVTYTKGEYVKQTNPLNVKQMSKIKKIVMEQQKDTLQRINSQIKRFQRPCSDIRSVASIVELQGKNILSLEDMKTVQELQGFYI